MARELRDRDLFVISVASVVPYLAIDFPRPGVARHSLPSIVKPSHKPQKAQSPPVSDGLRQEFPKKTGMVVMQRFAIAVEMKIGKCEGPFSGPQSPTASRSTTHAACIAHIFGKLPLHPFRQSPLWTSKETRWGFGRLPRLPPEPVLRRGDRPSRRTGRVLTSAFSERQPAIEVF
jgi:hypothetical protein